MSAVAGEAAFEEGEGVDREGFGSETSVAFEEPLDCWRRAAVPAGEGDVRVKGAMLGLEPGGDAGALDLGRERRHWLARLNRGPNRPAIALRELADATERE